MELDLDCGMVGDLVARCVAGDDGAVELLLGRWKGILANVAKEFRRDKEDREDLFQDLCIHLTSPRTLQSLDLTRPDLPWVKVVARNRAKKLSADSPLVGGLPLVECMSDDDLAQAHERAIDPKRGAPLSGGAFGSTVCAVAQAASAAIDKPKRGKSARSRIGAEDVFERIYPPNPIEILRGLRAERGSRSESPSSPQEHTLPLTEDEARIRRISAVLRFVSKRPAYSLLLEGEDLETGEGLIDSKMASAIKKNVRSAAKKAGKASARRTGAKPGPTATLAIAERIVLGRQRPRSASSRRMKRMRWRATQAPTDK